MQEALPFLGRRFFFTLVQLCEADLDLRVKEYTLLPSTYTPDFSLDLNPLALSRHIICYTYKGK